MLLNRRGHSHATDNPTSIQRHASKSVIWSASASPASLLLVDHLLVHLLSLELLLAGDGVLELLDVLVQELFLRLLLLLQVVALLRDLLHHRVRFFDGGRRFKVRNYPRVLVHLARGAGVPKVCLGGGHSVRGEIVDSVSIGACGIISRGASKTALRNQVHWSVHRLLSRRGLQNDFSCWVILRSLILCTCHFVIEFSGWHSQKGRWHLLLWLLTIRYLLWRGCRCDLVRVSNQISDIFDQIVIFFPLPVVVW